MINKNDNLNKLVIGELNSEIESIRKEKNDKIEALNKQVLDLNEQLNDHKE